MPAPAGYRQLSSGFWVKDDGSGPYFVDATTGIPTPIGTSSANAAYMGQLATHSFQPTTSGGANTQTMSRSAHVAAVDITSLQLVYPNWYGAELNNGGVATVTCSIEYPVGVIRVGRFNTATSGTIPAGDTLMSDPISVSIPEGATFYVRSWFSNPSGALYSLYLNGSNQGMGEAFNLGPAIADQTASGVVSTLNGNALYGPIAILGITTKPSVLVIGDSRSSGQNESTPTNGSPGTTEVGQITRSLFPGMAFINCSTPGERAQLMAANLAKRSAMVQYVTSVIFALAINDLGNSRTAAQIIADIATIKAAMRGRKCYSVTILPYSTSTDAFATVVNQTTHASNPQRILFNAAVRAGLSEFAGYFELADTVESARDSGLWRAPGYTTDGLHGNVFAYNAIEQAEVLNPALITRA